MSEKRQFPTPAMLKAREELAKMTPEEKEASKKAMRAKLERYYGKSRIARMTVQLMEEAEDEIPEEAVRNTKRYDCKTYEERLIEGYRHIIDSLAEDSTAQIVKKTIRELQKCKRDSGMMYSEAEGGLDNLWDEICVQIQNGYSDFWVEYEDYALSIIKKLLESCRSTTELQLIWLQTDAFYDWSCCESEPDSELDRYFNENNFPVDYNIDDIATYIWNKVFDEAWYYQNRRIENYPSKGGTFYETYY